ncbi:hypothetical protein PRIC1_006161 [Phytophthora ramorum]|uniref:Serine/threonine-protein kinase-like protein CCR2 n=1 Tax=Phytophthora ramorum TaxID=164328 RepID=UPI0030B69C58|nr:Serine/threonine-protein kinase-like protein CCR2 [Phytophthora ramorum]KAH7506374.1 Serine/threonine-protein kinase-like protein CCR2 [Phytophthora ramorum]
MSWLLHLVLACVSTQTALSDATTDALVPDVIVPLDIDETSIAAGIEHSCAIQTQSYEDVGGRVVCWGVNNGGQSSPPPGDFIQVSTGRLHSCGIRIDETLECWGIGAPVTKPEGLFEQVSSGDFHSCGIMKDQTIKCWGTAAGGISNAPGGKFVQVSCGKDFSCAIATDGAVKCWGENGHGQLNADPTARFRQISSSSGDFACGVTEDNTLSCWGDNHRDQASPPTDEKFILVSTSRLAACGVKVDKTVVCWGMRSGVTAAPTDVQFDELTLGWNHGCGIRFEDGGVQCWGDRGSNRLEIPEALR